MTTFDTPVALEDRSGRAFSVAFKRDGGLQQDELTEALRTSVDLCRRMVAGMRGLLSSATVPNQVLDQAKYYFRMNAEAFRDYRPTLEEDLTTLQNGINTAFLLKISPVIATTTGPKPSAGGMTKMKSLFARQQNGEVGLRRFPADKAFRPNIVARDAVSLPSDDRFETETKRVYASNVHLKAEIFARRGYAAIAMLHEFCHKFLGYHDGLDDKWYFGHDGVARFALPPGVDPSPAGPVLARNADAMAWFVAKSVGKIDGMDLIAALPRNRTCVADLPCSVM